VLDENTPLVGVPAVAKHNPAASQRFYFALVSRELAGPVGSASMSLSFPSTPSQVRFPVACDVREKNCIYIRRTFVVGGDEGLTMSSFAPRVAENLPRLASPSFAESKRAQHTGLQVSPRCKVRQCGQAPSSGGMTYARTVHRPPRRRLAQEGAKYCPVQGGEVRSNLMPDTIPFDDLDLGPLLGKGSFGRVYRGHWEGNPVAVKVCWLTATRCP